MKIMLDTTYYLPAISVNIEGVDPLLLRNLMKNTDYQLFYCEITLFELAAKGARLIQLEELLNCEDITKGLDSIRWDKRLINLPWYTNPLILELATEIRKIHADFIDCLILSTAVYHTNVLATYDDELYKNILKEKDKKRKILEINDSFAFWFNDLSKEKVSIT